MKNYLNYLCIRLVGVLAVIIIAGAPAQADAAGIAFRNETPSAVIVQGASVVNGMIRRGKPLVILPKRVGIDINLGSGPRQITIYDPVRKNRILLKQTIQFGGRDILFSIRPNPRPAPYPLMLAPR